MRNREKKKVREDIQNQVGTQFGNAMSKNVQMGTDKAIEGMDLFKWKAERVAKVGFDQAKGNLFEYIEVAKLQTNMANKGYSLDRNPLTDAPISKGGYGENTAPDDFRLKRDGKTISRGQAKYNIDEHDAAVNFSNKKYAGMQRIAPTDQIDEIEAELLKMKNNGAISKKMYDDAVSNLKRKGLTDPQTGISSGGTTTNEIMSLRGQDGKVSPEAVKRYVMKFEAKQVGREMGQSAINSAAATAVTTGIVSGVTNLADVLSDKKELKQAMKDIGKDVAKGSARGGATGVIQTILRFGGKKANVALLSDSSAATVIAGSVIDGGVALYSYAKGEISSEQLRYELVNTTAKATATIYFSKAAALALGTTNAFVPMAIYSVASYIVTSTREIIKNAELNAEEYRRMKAMLEESTALMKEYHKQLVSNIKQYEENQQKVMRGFLDNFDYNIETGENYSEAIYSIVNFANETGVALQYAKFDDYSEAMKYDDEIVFK